MRKVAQRSNNYPFGLWGFESPGSSQIVVRHPFFRPESHVFQFTKRLSLLIRGSPELRPVVGEPHRDQDDEANGHGDDKEDPNADAVGTQLSHVHPENGGDEGQRDENKSEPIQLVDFLGLLNGLLRLFHGKDAEIGVEQGAQGDMRVVCQVQHLLHVADEGRGHGRGAQLLNAAHVVLVHAEADLQEEQEPEGARELLLVHLRQVELLAAQVLMEEVLEDEVADTAERKAVPDRMLLEFLHLRGVESIQPDTKKAAEAHGLPRWRRLGAEQLIPMQSQPNYWLYGVRRHQSS